MVPEVRTPGTGMRIALIVFSFLVILHLPGATEPDGNIRLRALWVAPASSQGTPDPGRKILRVEVEALVPLSDCLLTATFPQAAPARLMTPPPESDGPSFFPSQTGRIIPIRIGSIATRASHSFRFDIEIPETGGGFASILVTGRDARGRQVSEAAKIVIGSPGPAEVPRHGAIEFPAASKGKSE